MIAGRDRPKFGLVWLIRFGLLICDNEQARSIGQAFGEGLDGAVGLIEEVRFALINQFQRTFEMLVTGFEAFVQYADEAFVAVLDLLGASH